MTDVVILGAGAAGLMCAMHAARRRRSVLVLDHASKTGRKLRVTGGGRCNFTNLVATPADYACANPHFVKSALSRYTPWDFLAFLEQAHLGCTYDSPAMCFCREGADAVADLLEREARRAGASLRLGVDIERVLADGEGFRIESEAGPIAAGSVVVATGGPAWPQVGATRIGHEIARSFGLGVTPLRPGLVPLVAGPELAPFCRELTGISLPVRITTTSGHAIAWDLLFTHKGISGPAVLDASIFWRPGETLTIDLLPGLDPAEHEEELLRLGKMDIRNALARSFTRRMAAALCELHKVSGTVGSIPRTRLRALTQTLAAWPFTPAGDAGWAKAEVTMGGVDTDGVSSKTMEAKSVPGLYFVGEVLDVTGRLGGYNLQWAWSSGFAAGTWC
jgi:hypothetical protein